MKFHISIVRYKNIIGFALFLFCIVTFGLYIPSRYVVPVIMYHRIDENSATSSLSVSPQSFERQMNFLKKHKYNVVPVTEVARILREKRSIPPKTIAITFDDGYEDNYRNAYPVLKKLDLPATIFVVTDWIGKEGYMTWEQLGEVVQKSKITIGSHTVTHPHLPSLSDGEIGGELVSSKNLLEQGLGEKVNMLSYPGGGFDKNVIARAVVHNYQGAVATNPGRSYRNDDPYAIKRIRISKTSDSLFVFWIETSGFYTWIKEHRDED